MIETPEVINVPVQLIAKLHLEIPPSKMQREMGPAIGEAMTAVREQRIGPTGAWFAHHREPKKDLFNFDICVPVSAQVKPTGRVKPGERPSMRVVKAIYRGPYEGLSEAWQAFDKMCAAQGLRTASDLYERYLVGPESTQNPNEWQTELSRAVMEK